MKPAEKLLRFRRVRRDFRLRWPNMMHVNQPARPQPSTETRAYTEAAPFAADGFNFPRPQDTFFDVIVRVASIPVSATTTQVIFTQEENIKAGWIRYLGYGFNSPHGFFQVRATLLINGVAPSNYIFKTVDTATGTYQGSFPTVQIGTIQEPTPVYIHLPSNAVVSMTFVNASADEAFSAAVRLKGWSFGD